MRVIITGGGTGGHTSPAVAILEALRQQAPRLDARWIGKRGGIEERVSAAAGLPFHAVAAGGWPRGLSLKRLTVLAKLLWGTLQSLALFVWHRPDAALGVGGYVSLGPLFAAQILGVPTFLHEQNKRLGLANRLLARRAACLFLSFEDTVGVAPGATTQVVGNPVRAGFRCPPETGAAKAALQFDPALPLVLIVGGSQGAQSINAAVADLVAALPPGEAQVLWMTGRGDAVMAEAAAGKAASRVVVRAFIDDMVTACAAADLVVCRAGASTTAELAALGKPAILVPYPHATDNHQEHNARAFEAAGAAEVLLDAACTGAALTQGVRALLADPARLQTMGAAARTLDRQGAAEAVAARMVQAAAGTS
jgi:UDP-N-acetylglucosamine--N-acetylmuramyl-(pentapeptide) pyrophosphoryl-undecaprenol N-acetylglucosamine transferase